MAPPSADWKKLLKVKPNTIDIENDADEDQNENYGSIYVKVRV